MKFVKKIRESRGLNPYQMQKLLGIKSTQVYLQFENAKESLNAEKLINLWDVSEMDGNDFLELIREDVQARKSKNKG